MRVENASLAVFPRPLWRVAPCGSRVRFVLSRSRLARSTKPGFLRSQARSPASQSRNRAAIMLGTRVASGIFMIVLLAGVLFLDEWFAPWFPFWFALCLVALTAASIELVNLLRDTSSRP